MSVYRIYNQRDMPRLSNGWRSVIALAPGRKWMTIVDWTTFVASRGRINPLPLDARNGARLASFAAPAAGHASRSLLPNAEHTSDTVDYAV